MLRTLETDFSLTQWTVLAYLIVTYPIRRFTLASITDDAADGQGEIQVTRSRIPFIKSNQISKIRIWRVSIFETSPEAT